MVTVKEEILKHFSFHSDEPEIQDLYFDFNIFAEQIKNLVMDKNLHTPYVIAIHGEWGSGKTTLINKVKRLIDEEISKNPTVKQWKTLEFDAWEYERLDIVSSLFQKIARLYKTKGKKLSEFATAFGMIFTDIALRATSGLSFKELKEHLEHIEEEIPTIRITIGNMIGNNRLIVFVDDLDRCHVDNVLSMLEAIKMFLSAKGIIFVMAVDLQKIERAWQLRYNVNEGLIEGRHHVEKIFQLQLSLPPKLSPDLVKLIDKFVSNLDTREKRLILTACKANPRRLKRLINLIYFVLKNLADDENFYYKIPITILWSALISNHRDVAKIIKDEPICLAQLCFICTNLSLDSLRGNWNKIKTVKEHRQPIQLNSTNMSHTDVNARTLDCLELVKDDSDLFRLFEVFGQDNAFAHISTDDPSDVLTKLTSKHTQIFMDVVGTGLIGV